MNNRAKEVLLALLLSAGFTCISPGQQDAEHKVRIKLHRTNPRAVTRQPSDIPIRSYFFEGTEAAKSPRSFVSSIYPGIDMYTFGDSYELEYVFVARRGAHIPSIRFGYRGVVSPAVSGDGSVKAALAEEGSMIQGKPVGFLHQGEKKTRVRVDYVSSYGNTFFLEPGPTYSSFYEKLNGTVLNIVPPGGMPGGPDYEFYVSKYETTNDQLIRFLNNAQINTNNVRGTNMWFGKKGDVWFSPEKGRDNLIFDISESRIIYDLDRSAGERYRNYTAPDGDRPFRDHPAAGMSWFGAVKYCNWMTIDSGRGAAERCYSEGTNWFDWAPLTATNWANGEFTVSERRQWLGYKGFRLPMLGTNAFNVTTNRFNEFLKAAAWDGSGITTYGFGRNEAQETDANFGVTVKALGLDTAPVGFFNGDTAIKDRETRHNANLYGIYDMSGNAAEWINASPPSPAVQAVAGGSSFSGPRTVFDGEAASQRTASSVLGFRVCTTYVEQDVLVIHIPVRFYLEPGAPPDLPPDEVEPEEIEAPKMEPPEEPRGIDFEIRTEDEEGFETVPENIQYSTNYLTEEEEEEDEEEEEEEEEEEDEPEPLPSPPISPGGA